MGANLVVDHEKIHINLARIKKGGKNFEIVIDADKAMDFKSKKTNEIHEVLKSSHIFSDAHKGIRASESDMLALFLTKDELEVAAIILNEGEIQLTTEFRERLREEKRLKIVDIISRNAIDPRSGLPHPRQRILNALEELHSKVDEHKSAEDQIANVIEALKPILPIVFETRSFEIIIPSNFAPKSYSTIKNYAKIIKEEWLDNGSLRCIVEMPAGIQNDFFEKINSITHGNNETKIIKTK